MKGYARTAAIQLQSPSSIAAASPETTSGIWRDQSDCGVLCVQLSSPSQRGSVVRRAGYNQQRNRLSEVLQPVIWMFRNGSPDVRASGYLSALQPRLGHSAILQPLARSRNGGRLLL